jgi:hypothetical protein
MRTFALIFGCAAVLAGASSVATAQGAPPAGVRAAGMAGAFVGVADDASAVYWNPAGLASGAFFSLVLDRSTVQPPMGQNTPDLNATFVAVGTPPLGVTYYRTTFPVVAPGRGSVAGQQPGASEMLVAHQFGVTVDQSLHDGLAIGATVKAIRGITPDASKTAFDADIGVMAAGAVARAGLVVRNAFEPELSIAQGPVRLERSVRGGVSLLIREMVRLAADADFTTADVSGGRWRDAAVGAEAHPFARAWIRSGVHWNTAGGPLDAAPVVAVGGSAAVYGSILVDAQVSVGSKNGNRGWGAGLRYNF